MLSHICSSFRKLNSNCFFFRSSERFHLDWSHTSPVSRRSKRRLHLSSSFITVSKEIAYYCAEVVTRCPLLQLHVTEPQCTLIGECISWLRLHLFRRAAILRPKASLAVPIRRQCRGVPTTISCSLIGGYIA